ncbi:MAG: undecaprenyl-diphosphate phosphatase [Waddliaceae bacterium]
MTIIEALILGAIQGITEFLPISSSGHLILGQKLFGFEKLDQYILFDLICHIGTLLPICLLFSEQLKKVFSKKVILGTLPLFPLLLILSPIKSLYNDPKYLGFFFLLTALLLLMGRCVRIKRMNNIFDAIIIGVFQALAILPGVSRSGATISSAKSLGWSNDDAVQFSFLLAIPAILGGMVVESVALMRTPQPLLDLSVYTAGFVSSMIVGFVALGLLVQLVKKEKLHYFVWYCIILGTYTLWTFRT